MNVWSTSLYPSNCHHLMVDKIMKHVVCSDDDIMVTLQVTAVFLILSLFSKCKLHVMMCAVQGASSELNMNNKRSENHGGLYTSQAVESYLRFPTTASPCADWLPCQAEAVCAKTMCWGDVRRCV